MRRTPHPGGAGPADPDGWAGRATEAVAGFTSTRSKSMEALFAGPGGPTHAVSSEGCEVRTAEGRVLLDWTMALGAVALGYGHPRVAEAAARAAYRGGVSGLPPIEEVELAERLCAAYPGAEQARFLKTGAEGVAAAVRMARVATGREVVVSCGYHGWLDGPTHGAGVPEVTARLWQPVPFGDVAALRAAVGLHRPAALVLEPVIEREPPAAWLAAARDLCGGRTGDPVLIFDEIKTGFRVAQGGAAERWGVAPDLAVLGKALANGFPLAAVVGRADVMARASATWISSTLATEQVALAAALAVLDVWEAHDVAGHIARVGAEVRAALTPVLGGVATVEGIDAMWFLRFGDAAQERRVLLACAGHGLLLKRGAYNFPCLAHDTAAVERTAAMLRAALAAAT